MCTHTLARRVLSTTQAIQEKKRHNVKIEMHQASARFLSFLRRPAKVAGIYPRIEHIPLLLIFRITAHKFDEIK
jgi:hypothetical protein